MDNYRFEPWEYEYNPGWIDEVYRPALEDNGSAETTESIKSIFDKHTKDLKIDQVLAKKISDYRVSFIHRNREHAAFFGGNLLGVQVVRFLDTDSERWFDTIVNIDELEVQEEIHALPTVNPEFNISSNIMNQSCVYLVHRFNNSPLPMAVKKEAMVNILVILQMKFITSLLVHYFRYPADKALAEATYASLNNKFAIKEHGSWLKVLEQRALDTIGPQSIHLAAINQMAPDFATVNMLNDMQGRIRSYVKNIYAVMEQVRTTGGKINVTSSNAVGHDGVEILRDSTKGISTYTQYIKNIIADKKSFIRDELVDPVVKAMPSTSERFLVAALEHISDSYYQKNHQDINKILELTLVHGFHYLSGNRQVLRANTDLADMLIRLRGAYTSSRSSDPYLLEMRQLTEKVIRPAVKTKTDSVVANVRTAVLLYIMLRTYTKRHYTGS